MSDDLRYPIGKFEYPAPLSPEQRRAAISVIKRVPGELEAAIADLTPAQLDTPYRPGGWTVRQVVHHLGDSHAHILIRFKYALCHDGAPILPFEEEEWALLPDSTEAPVELGLALVRATHAKWAWILDRMQPADFDRGFQHPKSGRVTLDKALAIYSWHGAHHVAHITALRKRSGW